MLKFDDGSHCHWSYRAGSYRSFYYWPTREDVAEYLADHERDGQTEIIQIHGANCFCEVADV